MARLLLDRGADLSSRDKVRRADCAVGAPELALVRKLPAHAIANAAYQRMVCPCARSDEHRWCRRAFSIMCLLQAGLTTLLMAVAESHESTVKLLLSRGADAEALTDVSGRCRKRFGHLAPQRPQQRAVVARKSASAARRCARSSAGRGNCRRALH